MLTYFFSFWGDFVHSPFDIVAVFGDNVAGFGDNVAVFGDIVAGVDGALQRQTTITDASKHH